MMRRGDQHRVMQDRLVWQSASLLLAYPDGDHRRRLDLVDRMREEITGHSAALLGRTVAALRNRTPMQAAVDYVDTFDLRRGSTMFLTYWSAGDTRNRGAQMHGFVRCYHDAGVRPPAKEAPDHLPVVLEFAATVDPDSGRALLTEHRVAIGVLRQALTDAASPYAHAVEAVCETLPRVGADAARHLLSAGPPAESVGLQPFQLTVPPRRRPAGMR